MAAKIRSEDDQLLERALQTASHTRLVRVEHALRHEAPIAFREVFGRQPAMIVADTNTFAAAGQDVFDSFRRAGHPCLQPHVFDEPNFHAEYKHIERL